MEQLKDLNEAQQKAVQHLKGPMMIIAGAGSGKTRALTYRIAYLIHNGVDPFRILALTFTNKAAREMKERIASITGSENARNIWMGTFHSIFSRILRVEHQKIGYPRNFSIYDTTDSKNLIKRIVKDKGLDPKVYKPGLVYHRISSAKNNLLSPKAYMENEEIQEDDAMSGKPELGNIYWTYTERCFKAGAMDFDDLLFKTNVLLRDHPKVLNKYQQRFEHVLVDEYQDTNYSQYLIVKKLSAVNENLCVVGDDAQSIYGFRGANIYNILNFKKDFPDYSLYKLEQNYRSTESIVKAANSLIKNNKDQIEKEVWTNNSGGEVIEVFNTLTDNEEGRKVADLIYENKVNDATRYSDFAILYRTNAQSRSLEEALRKNDIPYKIYGGLSFYQRKEIKDLLAYLRLTVNHQDEEALKRVINYPKRGIGNSTLEKAIVKANQHGVSLWEVISRSDHYQLEINSGARNKLNQFVTMIQSFATMLETKNAYDLAQHIASSTGILKELYTDKTPEGISRYENIQELLNGIKEMVEKKKEENPDDLVSLSDFLIEVALLTDADEEDPENNDKVSLMTVHSAKGLEFPYIFIVGMEENLFPSQMALNSREDLEEERRLFYVAITRAEKKAYLSYSDSRYKWGQLMSCEPSRFIEEIDERYIELPPEEEEKPFDEGGSTPFGNWGIPGNGNKGSAKKNSPPKGVPTKKRKLTREEKLDSTIEEQQSPSAEDLTPGTEVEHSRFGKGKVLKLEGKAPNTKATVFFPAVGQKQLLLKFAKLTILN